MAENRSESAVISDSKSAKIFCFSSSSLFLAASEDWTILLEDAKWSRKSLIWTLTWLSAFGYSIGGASSSSTAAGAPFGGAFPLSLPFGGALPPFAPASSWSAFFTLGLFSLTIASSSSVSSSPAFYFFLRINFCLDKAAFSALPGSSASQDAFKAFSLSSLSVSLMRAKVSLLYTLIFHVISADSSFWVLPSGHS